MSRAVYKEKQNAHDRKYEIRLYYIFMSWVARGSHETPNSSLGAQVTLVDRPTPHKILGKISFLEKLFFLR